MPADRGPGRSGERQVSLRTGAVLVGWRSVAWRTPVAQADRPFLLDHFSALQDPRQQAKVLYPLPEILLLLLCATLAGADDVVEIALWGDEHLAFLRRFLPCKHGVPSHDTLGEVLAALDPGLFKACFVSWVEGLREAEPDLIAIDGKTSRRSHARSKGRGPLHLVSAWAIRQRLVLGQEAVAGKSNEIAAIPLLLERLALDGALVTIDAIGAQGAIAEVILERGGDYLLALKRNRPATFEDVEAFFADPPAMLDTFEATHGDHGRIEVRRHAVPPAYVPLRHRFAGKRLQGGGGWTRTLGWAWARRSAPATLAETGPRPSRGGGCRPGASGRRCSACCGARTWSWSRASSASPPPS